MTRWFHLCEACNEEFELPNQEQVSIVTCPHCKVSQHLWIRKEENHSD